MSAQLPCFTEGERAILGGCLLEATKIPEVLEALGPGDFYHERNRLIFESIQSLTTKRQPVDWQTLTVELTSAGRLEAAGGVPYLVELVDAVPSAANIMHYVERVKEKSTLRWLISSARETVAKAMAPGADASELISEVQKRVFDVAVTKREKGAEVQDINKVLLDSMQLIENVETQRISSGFASIDDITKGFFRGDFVLLGARPGMGKAQPLSAQVLLADGGYKCMGDLCVGDRLASVDGDESVVTGIFPQGIREIYTVELSDGRQLEADAEHLWDTESSRYAGCRQVTTLELRDLIRKVRYIRRVRLAQHSGKFGSVSSIGIDPWLLGFLLADGCLTKQGVHFSNPEPYIHDRVQQASGLLLHKVQNDRCDYRIFNGKNKPHPLRRALTLLGVMGAGASEKFVPEIVFQAKKEIRKEVFAGLMEGDGWIEKKGSIRFGSSSKRLVYDVMRLVWSLSGSASHCKAKKTLYNYRGQKKDGLLAYQTTISMDGLASIFRSPRLLKNLRNRRKPTSPVVTSVEYTRNDAAQCISVSHPSAQYITDGYCVTHNTAIAAQIAQHIAQKEPVLIRSLEMPNRQLGLRYLSSATGLNLRRLRSGHVGPSDWAAILDAAGKYSDLKLFFDESPKATVESLYNRCRQLSVKIGVKLGLLVVDYLQLMVSKERHESQVVKLEAITRGLKLLAREIDAPVIGLSQLNRDLEKRELWTGGKPLGKRPQLQDLRGSGSFEQDADTIIFLYRPDYYLKEQNDSRYDEWKNRAEAIVAKQRNGETGIARLLWNGPTTTFRDPEIRSDYQEPRDTSFGGEF